MALFGTKKDTPKVLFVASESAPFAKVGGLGEVMFSLPRALRRIGYDARVMIPRYLSVDPEKYHTKMVWEGLEVPSGDDSEPIMCNVKMFDPSQAGEEHSPVPNYFLENEEYFERRANVYGYGDDAVRWALLARGTLEFLRISEWRPDVIVSCDWQSGLLANYIHAHYKNDPIISKIAVLFSIHNLGFQANFDHHFVSEMDYDSGQSDIPSFNDPKLLKLNPMRRSIMYADVINTVSPTYAQEITTPDYGELLHELLAERRGVLYGILNGIDYEEWNPETDRNVEVNFSLKTIAKRAENKSLLQRKFNLPESEDSFLMGIVSRLTDQKGFDMMTHFSDSLFNNFDIQLIVQGTGDSKYISYFTELQQKFPKKVAIHLSYDPILPRMIYSGADATLIPSRYEPCGLTQMEAMRYGSVPIVRKTGGLADSVDDFDIKNDSGDGFVFEHYDNYALFGTIIRAMEVHRHKKIWHGIQERAMKADFSWENSAREYGKLFLKAIDHHLNKLGE